MSEPQLESLFDDLYKNAYNYNTLSYDVKQANQIIREHLEIKGQREKCVELQDSMHKIIKIMSSTVDSNVTYQDMANSFLLNEIAGLRVDIDKLMK